MHEIDIMYLIQAMMLLINVEYVLNVTCVDDNQLAGIQSMIN